jgi:hypothetical protein
MMKRTSLLIPLAAALLASSLPQPASAHDWKQYSAGGCAPYTTATPNYSELRFRSDGVQNQADGYRYVICPVVRDADNTWGYTGADTGSVGLQFRTNTTGTFQCTLTGGSTVGGSYSTTQSVSGDPGTTLYMYFTGVDLWAEGLSDAPVSLVCRLPPKGTLAKYYVSEDGVTDDPHP